MTHLATYSKGPPNKLLSDVSCSAQVSSEGCNRRRQGLTVAWRQVVKRSRLQLLEQHQRGWPMSPVDESGAC